ncbi:MAG: hypothetical protein JXA43_02535 [Candidatus Diapherotrites archaeon]|nr:hypothetical protein [Candidatus Diapherotrites archaeon]
MKRVLALSFCMLVILSVAPFIDAKELTSIDIGVFIDKAGNADVKEIFVFTFANVDEKDEFLDRIGRFGADVTLWNVYDSNLYPHIGQAEQVFSQSASARVEGINGIVELNYQTNGATKLSPQSVKTLEKWELDNSILKFPIRSGLLQIDENIKLTMNLPEGAEIKEIAPHASISGYSLTWVGPLAVNRLVMNYEFQKVLVPSSIIQLPTISLQDTDKIGLIIGFTLLGLVIFLKRKSLRKRVGNYVVEHSLVKPIENYEERESLI